MDKKPNILPYLDYDFSFGSNVVGGIDEVGRGPWAGPLVSAIVVIKADDMVPKGINDSKKLSQNNREELFAKIVNSLEFTKCIIDSETIDDLGLGNAVKLSMKQVYENLALKPKLVLVDGLDKIDIEARTINIVKGDTKSVAIAAASIVAKVTRDRIMKELALIYPNYFWEKNVGYGTKQHIDSIARFGLTPQHRKSFKPIKNYIIQNYS